MPPTPPNVPSSTVPSTASPVTGASIVPESSASPVTFTVVPRNISFHFITKEELENLAEGKASLQLSLFGISIGVMSTSLGTLFSTDLQGKTFLVFEGLAITTTLLTLYFGIGAYREWKVIKDRIKHIASRTEPR